MSSRFDVRILSCLLCAESAHRNRPAAHGDSAFLQGTSTEVFFGQASNFSYLATGKDHSSLAKSGVGFLVLGAMRTAEDGVVLFDSVADHFTAAMCAGRGEHVDRTLETVESVLASGLRNCERIVKVVSAKVTNGHFKAPSKNQLEFVHE